MPRRGILRRHHLSRPVGRKILIACEGIKTEHGYFQAIRSSLRLPTLQVVVLRPDGTDPLTVVRRAILERNNLKKDRAWDRNDQAWAVFDGDEHKDNNPTNWNNAIQLAQSNQIQLAISNPCFELWYILHFQDCERCVARDDAQKLLRKHINNYSKAAVLWPRPLQPLTTHAVLRAKHLMTKYQRDDLNQYYNPSSGVWELVEALLALRKETHC